MNKIILMLLILISSQLEAVVATVGDVDNGCTYSTISEAIQAVNDGLASVVRVTTNSYTENLILDDIDIEIIGGYIDCQAADTDDKSDIGFTLIAENANESVITITSDQSSTIHLENMMITGGSYGIYGNESTVDLTIQTVTITENAGYGLFINQGQHNVLLNDVTISANEGSGVRCDDEPNIITIKGNSQLTENTAPSYGGGLYANLGCHIDVFSPTVITKNHAQSLAGGIMVNAFSQVNLYGVKIQGNTAVNGGAAFYVYALSELFISQSTISGNTVSVENALGGLGLATNKSTVTIENSLIAENDVNSNVLFADGLNDISILNLKYVTMVNNNSGSSAVFTAYNGAEINVESSIIHSTSDVIFSGIGSPNINLNCAIVNEMGTYDGNDTVTTIIELFDLFVNPNIPSGDYHLKPGSLAIDYCATAANINPDYPFDIDGQDRGVDQPGVDNGGIYDLGADAYYDDLIFMNGFES